MNKNRRNWAIADAVKLHRMYTSGRLTIQEIADRLNRAYFATIKYASRIHCTYNSKRKKKNG